MPKVFGWQHLIYLAIFVILAISSLIAIYKFCKSERSKFIVIKITAAVLLILVIWNRICIATSNEDAYYLISNTFCGVTSFVFAISALALKKDNCVLHCMIYCAFVGGLIVTIYPEFVGQDASFLYPNTISGLLHHSVSFYLAVLMFMTKWVTPSLKKWKNLPLGLCIMMTYGIFLLTITDRLWTDPEYDAMYITAPLISGSILTWYFVGFLLLLAHIIFLLCYTYIPVFMKKIKKTEN